MHNEYDAIIIGSGLGGLTAAATLARNGKRVAVFERHTQPGGYATTFYKDNFEFEVSLHAMSGIGTEEAPGPLRPYLKELGVLNKVRFIPLNDLYRTISTDIDITIPKSSEQAKRLLKEAFPHEAAGIDSFIDQILAVGEEVQLIKEKNHSTAPIPTLAKFPNVAHAAGSTVADVMDRLVKDARTKLVLGQLWAYFGLPPSKLSFLLFAAGVSSYLKWGSVTIEGKSQSLSNAFAEVIREHGGKVHLAEGVKEILVRNGKVVGIVSDHGNQYTTSVVISNADPYSTLNHLIAEEHVPPMYKRRIEAADPSAGSVTLYLGLNRPSREIGITNHELYLNLSTDMDEQWDKCQTLDHPGVISVCAYDNANPKFAPTGKGVIAVTVLSMGTAWEKLSKNQYTIEKQRFGEGLMSELEKAFPGVRDAVETQLISTPITNMRYTGNTGGAIYGFAATPQENPGFRMDNRGPINGLWFAGAWTRPSAGYQGVITSGINTANDILTAECSTNCVPFAAMTTPATIGRTFQRRMRGFALMLRDGKKVGKVIRSKYRTFSNEPLTLDFSHRYQQTSQFHAQNLAMRIGEKFEETSDTVTLRLISNNGDVPTFEPGQYLEVSAVIAGRQVSRSYSISSAPSQKHHIDITVKAQRNGTMSKYLVYHAQVGDMLSVFGPFGEFTYNPLRDSRDVVAIAVGSGITPLISMLKSMEKQLHETKIHLVYGSRSEEDIIFHNEINKLCQRVENLQVTHVLTSPSPFWRGERGRVNARVLDKILDQRFNNKTFFICGPSSMYAPLVQWLRQRNVPMSAIHFESFATCALRPKTTPRNVHMMKFRFSNWNPLGAPLCHLPQIPGLVGASAPSI